MLLLVILKYKYLFIKLIGAIHQFPLHEQSIASHKIIISGSSPILRARAANYKPLITHAHLPEQ